MFTIADQKKVTDGEVQKYLPFYKNCLRLDEQDIRLCETLEEKLKLLQLIHGDAKKERDKKRLEEAKKKATMEEAVRKAQEEEERARALQKTVKRLEQQEPGQVWNPILREYQDLTDVINEPWRG